MPRISLSPRLNHLAYLLMAGTYRATDAQEYVHFQRANRHARGETPYITGSEWLHPTTGEILGETPEGAAIRLQLDTLASEGTIVTAAQLHVAYERQLVLRMKRERRVHRPEPTLQQRLEYRLLDRTGRAALHLDARTPLRFLAAVVEHDPQRRVWLIRGYSGMEHVRHLAGVEGGQIWITRLPDHVASIEAAGGACAPPALLRARNEGRQTRRHGDLWIAEVDGGSDDLGNLPPAYWFDATWRLLRHPEHGSISLPFRFGVWPTAGL